MNNKPNGPSSSSSPPVRLGTLGVLYAALTFATVYAVAEDDKRAPANLSMPMAQQQHQHQDRPTRDTRTTLAADPVSNARNTDRWQRVSSAQ